MRILLINHYAGSPRHGMEYRPYYLAREWTEAGHTVRILAADQTHLRQRGPCLGGRTRLEEAIDGIQYWWLRTPRYQGNGLGRVRNIAAFLMAVWRLAPALAAQFRPELVIASSTYPADIWPARRIARLAGARLVFEVHDLWPLTPMELGRMRPWHPFILAMQAAEDSAYRNADSVVSLLPQAGSHMAAHGLDLSKLHVVPNGVAVREWQDQQQALAPHLAKRLQAWRAQGRCVLVYAGSHGQANALSVLLDAAALLDTAALEFVLAGSGPELAALQAQAARLGLRHLHFVGALPKAQVPALLALADMAYLGWRRQPLYRFGIAPNKLADYMMAALPVVHAVEAGNDPVREAGCGLSVAPEDPAALARAIATLAQLAPAARRALGARGRAYALRHLDYAVLAPRFLSACMEVAS